MAAVAWPKVAVVGAGAVGCYFGGRLARAGAPVTLIGRQRLVDAVSRDGLLIDSIEFQERVAIAATTDPGAVADADLVLLAVKTLDTETAAAAIAPHLGSTAVLVSLQNGVDNAERIRRATGIDAVPAVVYVAAEMTGPGTVKHTGRGDLVIGRPANQAASRSSGLGLDRIAEIFGAAGVPCRVAPNVEGELWVKLIMNSAYNAISALTGATYGRIAADEGGRALMRTVVDEALAVAGAAGVVLPAVDLVEAALRLGAAMPHAISSTAQDIARGKPTEIESLNGYLARTGARLGIPTPANDALRALVKLGEPVVPPARADRSAPGSTAG